MVKSRLKTIGVVAVCLLVVLIVFASEKVSVRAQTEAGETGNFFAPANYVSYCPWFSKYNYSASITGIAFQEYNTYYQHSFSDNKTPYNKETPGEPWCASFASWVYQKAGFNVAKESNSRKLLEQFSSNGINKGFPLSTFTDPTFAAPGDLIVWKRTGTKDRGHTGIVYQNDCQNRIIKTIEGNAEGRQIRVLTYTYEGVSNRYIKDVGTKGGFELYGFGRWHP